MLYIAYGLNMDREGMKLRCPTATFLGMAKLNGYRLEFRTFATVVPDENSYVPVMVWDIKKRDEQTLDRVESYPEYYRKETVEFDWAFDNNHNEKSGKDKAMIYIMNEGRGRLSRPSQGYYDLIKFTWVEYGFPVEPLQEALFKSKKAI